MDAPARKNLTLDNLDNLEAVLRTLPPFTARVVERMVRRGRLAEALQLVEQNQSLEAPPRADATKQAAPPPTDPTPPKSAGLLIAEALRYNPDDHPLPCPQDSDPRWQVCKARAVQRIKITEPPGCWRCRTGPEPKRRRPKIYA